MNLRKAAEALRLLADAIEEPQAKRPVKLADLPPGSDLDVQFAKNLLLQKRSRKGPEAA